MLVQISFWAEFVSRSPVQNSVFSNFSIIDFTDIRCRGSSDQQDVIILAFFFNYKQNISYNKKNTHYNMTLTNSSGTNSGIDGRLFSSMTLSPSAMAFKSSYGSCLVTIS